MSHACRSGVRRAGWPLPGSGSLLLTYQLSSLSPQFLCGDMFGGVKEADTNQHSVNMLFSCTETENMLFKLSYISSQSDYLHKISGLLDFKFL